MRALICALVLACVPACVSVDDRKPAQSALSAGGEGGSESSFEKGEPAPVKWTPPNEAAKRVTVIPGMDPGRSSYVVAVLDMHTMEDSEDKGFDLLRERAAEVGADAVIGAEFEHGKEGEVSHLSGMAVRYENEVKHTYVALAKLDIESEEDAEDKGLDRLIAQAKNLGADEIIDVTFEHGEEGGKGHLRGLAVKWTDTK